jgi:glycosyltransferase involved in cell wall biosynthesis
LKRLLFIVSEDWYFVSHRLHLAQAALRVGYEVGLITRVSSQRDAIESAGITVIDWNIIRRSGHPWQEFKSLVHLWRGIRSFQPDLVHAVAVKPVVYAALACRLSGVKARVSALGGLGFIFSSSKKSARLLRPFIVSLFRFALGGKKSLLILQNPDDSKLLLSAGVISKKQMRLIRGAGVDTDAFAPAQILVKNPMIILPARMLWDKGVGEFVDAARHIKAQKPNVRFVLVGTPDDQNPESVPVEQLSKWNGEGIVEWWGRMDNMPEVYNQGTVVCLPSSYGEGLPKSLLEAASCGLPIVTYDVPGCREVVQDQVNGFLVPLRDSQRMIKALMELLDNPDLCAQMGKAGREMVLNEFSQELVADQTMKVWEELLGSRS